MDVRARQLLEKLLRAYEKAEAGVRKRRPAITRSQLMDYHSERSLIAKESFEATMGDAKAQRAISLSWDGKPGEGFIDRIDLVDAGVLASFLNVIPLAEVLAQTRIVFKPYLSDFPVLDSVINKWTQLRTVRSLEPDSTQDWLDSIRTIQYCRKATISGGIISVPLREASYQIFKDAKRVERLTGPLDVLLTDSVEARPREPRDVLQELGLFREEHPARLAGNVIIVRTRVTSHLDAPYTGLPPPSVERLGSIPEFVMSIENQTTFHSEARQRCDDPVLLLYTAGMPSPAWRAMYARLIAGLPDGIPVYHWGDVDEGGFRIAATLAKDAQAYGISLKPWKMSPDDVPENLRRPASPATCNRMRVFAEAAGWAELGAKIEEAKFTIEQEGLA
ncbi:MAG: DUF2220 family protein [Betaproteobacteria bacterium]|nr:DUF2220 family protein [Betaproteobacteria bacterium]